MSRHHCWRCDAPLPEVPDDVDVIQCPRCGAHCDVTTPENAQRRLDDLHDRRRAGTNDDDERTHA